MKIRNKLLFIVYYGVVNSKSTKSHFTSVVNLFDYIDRHIYLLKDPKSPKSSKRKMYSHYYFLFFNFNVYYDRKRKKKRG